MRDSSLPVSSLIGGAFPTSDSVFSGYSCNNKQRALEGKNIWNKAEDTCTYGSMSSVHRTVESRYRIFLILNEHG